ncbi:chitotriosidase-1-like isoform X3 [Festucalex cinctus]
MLILDCPFIQWDHLFTSHPSAKRGNQSCLCADVLWSHYIFPTKQKRNRMHKIILFAGLCLATAWLGSTEKLVCVYDSASYRRWGIARFKIEDIQPNLCTHLIYSFVCTDSKLEIVPTYRDKKKFPLFKKLKNSNPHLKTILEVNLILNPLFSELIAAEEHRATFIKSAISILRNPYYMFDGINLVWLNTKKLLEVKNDFTKLIREFQDAFYAEAVESGYEKLLLTASVSAEPSVISHSYDVKHIAKDIDFFNVMTSDIEIIYLKGRPSFCLPEESFNKAASAVNYWKRAGAPTYKIILGIGVFGEAYTTDSYGNIQVVRGHLYDLPKGFWARYEVCYFLQRIDNSSTTQVVFDDITSIDTKVQYIQNHKLGGAYVLSLDLDDFNHISCSHDKKFPVIQHLHDHLALDYYH